MKLRELLDTLAQLDDDAEVFVDAGYDTPVGAVEVRQQAGCDRHGVPYSKRVYLKPASPL